MIIHRVNWGEGVSGYWGVAGYHGVGSEQVGPRWNRYKRLGSPCSAGRSARRLKLKTPNMPELKRAAEGNWR